MTKIIDTHGSNAKEWVGFDLDGTLAKYDGWKGIEHIGEPIPLMVVLAYIVHRLTDKDVKIFTARVAPRDGDDGSKARKYIGVWCEKNLGFVPKITHQKDASMICCIDDRAYTVEQNTGKLAGGLPSELFESSENTKKAHDISDGSYEDIAKVFSGLSDKERYYVAPGHPTFYGKVPPLVRTVAYDNGEPVGFADLFDGEPAFGSKYKRRAQVEIAVLNAARRKGIARRLALESIRKALKTGKVDHVDWHVVHGNKASASLAKALGFKPKSWWSWHPKFTIDKDDAKRLVDAK